MKHAYKAPPREHLMRAIVVVKDGDVISFLKYHRIADRPAAIKGFRVFLTANFPGWQYINFYGGISHDFLRREYRDTMSKPGQ